MNQVPVPMSPDRGKWLEVPRIPLTVGNKMELVIAMSIKTVYDNKGESIKHTT